jgi:N-acetylmuramoyl-L-alanine amidase
MEKAIVLSIAKLLKGRLDRAKGFKAHLVRDNDFFVPLRKRVEIARKHKADLFISIHADAAPRLSANGASVYVLSERGATSTTAKFLAQSQNSVDLLGAKSLLNLSDKDPMLAGVILDMSMNSTISSSLTLGKSVLESLSKTTRLHIPRTEQAAFAVLKSPDIPSILIETGFISNIRDCEKLRNPMYQKKLSDSIFSGVNDYFNKYPLDGTYLASMKNGDNANQIS